MVNRNSVFKTLPHTYLFQEIAQRSKAFLEKNPEASLINLGIGDTTEPISPSITTALMHSATRLGTQEGYIGYGPAQGLEELRKKISHHFYNGQISPENIFISDGAKCDLGRLQMLFGNDVTIAVQDPTYPVYIDGSLMQGVKSIIKIPCSPENDFWPFFSQVPKTDLIYWCSPNNPTGAVNTRAQLEELIAFARANNSIILFDAAYSSYINDSSLPKSIFEIDGAKDVSIEIGSFSKLAGFSGIRLGWTAIPNSLVYNSGESVKNDWKRLTSTIFNGASIISQHGGIAALQPQGIAEMMGLIQLYLKNASILKKVLEEKGFSVHGGDHAPYLWVRFPGRLSWDVFQEWLEKAHLVTTPGVGFGSSGEGFLRLSAFGLRKTIMTAASRIADL